MIEGRRVAGELSALLLGEAVGIRRWLAVLIGFAGVTLVIGPGGEIANIAVAFEYTYIIWAVLFGYLLWFEVPSANTVLGIVLLISGNLYILHRQLLNARRLRQTESAAANPYPVKALADS